MSFNPCMFRHADILFMLTVDSVGGGFFTGRYSSINDVVESGSRFDATTFQGQVRRYPLRINCIILNTVLCLFSELS